MSDKNDAAPETAPAAPAENKESSQKEKKAAPVKVPKPSDEEHKAKVDALKAEIEAINGKLAKIKEKLDALDELRSKDKGETGAILTKLRNIKDVIRKHIEELTGKRKELEKFRAMFDAEVKAEGEIRKRLGDYNSLNSINERIASLESKLSSRHHSLNEEKKVLAEISMLKSNRGAIKEYEVQRAKVTQIKEQRNAMAERVKVKSQEIDQYRLVEKKHKAELDAAREKNKRPEDMQPKKLIEERNELRKQREAKWESVRAAHREHKAALDEYYNAVRAARKARDEERKAAWEANKEAREAEERARIEEELQRDPWEGHKALCESLLAFLNKYTPEGKAAAEKEAAEAKAKAAAEKGKKPEDDEDFVKRNSTLRGTLVQKEDAGVWGGFDAISAKKAKQDKKAKKNKKNKAKAAALKPAAAAGQLSVDPHMMEDFKLIEVDAPLVEKDVPAAIEALKKRIDYYNNEAPRPTVEEVMAQRAKRRERKRGGDKDGADDEEKPAPVPEEKPEPKKKAAPKKKQAPPAVTDDAQFPSLGGAGAVSSPVVAGAWS